MSPRKVIPESKSPFPHPYWTAYTGIGPEPKCKDEWLIIEIGNSIRAKPEWKSKYKDPTISAKWRKEIADQFKDDTKCLEEVLDYTFKELAWIEKLEHQQLQGKFVLGCDEKIVLSDNSIDDVTKAEFLESVNTFAESIKEPDYHPGSDDLVVDLVHPSLFPVQYGFTPVSKQPLNHLRHVRANTIVSRSTSSLSVPGSSFIGSKFITNLIGSVVGQRKPEQEEKKVEVVEYSEAIAEVKKYVDAFGISKKYQWLPAVLELSDSGRFEFASYINNLHPIRNGSLYRSISDVFNSVLPGLNFVLNSFASKERLRIEIPDFDKAYEQEFHDLLDKIYKEEKEKEEANENYETNYERIDELYETKDKYLKKFPPVFEERGFDKIIDLKQFKNLKVIVKLANIELTPEKPKYPGGAWHVEGTINEDIVATVLYYYDVENISKSTLSFRTGYEDPKYEQGDSTYCTEIFGIEDGDKMVRVLGNVEAQQDRVVIFPNCYQHHVDAFELADKSRPGHRKILCFFIVDPYNELVVASDKVAPQQKEWWDDLDLRYGLIPQEVENELVNLKGKDWGQTLEEAKDVRKLLMEERSVPKDEDDYDHPFTREFSLCEH